MTIKILSEKRLIVEASINSRPAYMLIDTGASVSLVDQTLGARFAFMLGNSLPCTTIGANGGEMCIRYTKKLDLTLSGLHIYQVCASDLSGIIDSIERESGYRIAGIIGLPAIKSLEMQINASDKTIKFGY